MVPMVYRIPTQTYFSQKDITSTDPCRWVFMETLEEPADDPKKPGATLTEHFKKMKKCRVSGDVLVPGTWVYVGPPCSFV